jgi:hypothetical protein
VSDDRSTVDAGPIAASIVRRYLPFASIVAGTVLAALLAARHGREEATGVRGAEPRRFRRQ